MKLLVAGWPTDTDCDMKRACQDAGIDFTFLCLGPPNPYSTEYMGCAYTLATAKHVQEVLSHDYDLYLYKYPFWLKEWPSLQALIGRKPVVAWQTEQGPTQRAALASSLPFHCVAVNNRMDLAAYGVVFPEKKILSLPFGCVRWTPEELIPVERYRADLVADGTPHFACACEGGDKRRSVETMILPVLNKDIAFYGRLPHLDYSHDWQGIDWALPHFRGTYRCDEYPQVYSSAKIYLGITFNWRLGGWGVKLPRALSTGIPVIWQHTYGLAAEGLENTVHYFAPETSFGTRVYVEHLLGHEGFRRQIGRKGKQFALEHWEYGANLLRLAEEVNRV